MQGLTILNAMKKVLTRGVFIAAVAALIGLHATGVTAPGRQQLWSIVVHFQYQDGFEFDYVLEREVPTTDVPGYLADCDSSHRWGGDVVHYHCYRPRAMNAEGEDSRRGRHESPTGVKVPFVST